MSLVIRKIHVKNSLTKNAVLTAPKNDETAIYGFLWRRVAPLFFFFMNVRHNTLARMEFIDENEPALGPYWGKLVMS